MQKLLTILLLSLLTQATAQYPYQVGIAGSDAIDANDPFIAAWATTCIVQRGWQQITDTTLGKANYGFDSNAVGAANTNGMVSLGDGGMATLTFAYPIYNGQGADFAVFENGFMSADTLAFLELAFVEVSSDGQHFVRFPAHCHNDSIVQMGSFSEMDASKIKNLAGKYISGYGTPFDLEELKDSNNLNINEITHIRLVDVVGIVRSPFTTFDSHHHPINDPFPTPFPASGFDLDAVAVLHQNTSNIEDFTHRSPFSVYPNPFKDKIVIADNFQGEVRLWDMNGREIPIFPVNNTLNCENLASGMYILQLQEGDNLYPICIWK